MGRKRRHSSRPSPPTGDRPNETQTWDYEQALDYEMSEPPNGLPVYRLITGKSDESFSRIVSEALVQGYLLHGPPSVTFNGTEVIAAQALLWPEFKVPVRRLVYGDDDIPF
jgi:hypothetical protein